LPGWGAKSTAAVLQRFAHIDDIPADWRDWHSNATGSARLAATLNEQREQALLFRTLATLRSDLPLFKNVDALRWIGPTPAFEALARTFDRAAGAASRQSGKPSRSRAVPRR
jgi:hypothetical protein